MSKKNKIKSVCVFCGASNDVAQVFKDMAFDIGVRLAKNGITLVYGGGSTGLMGAVAEGALSKKGKVIGVYPDILKNKEAEHKKLTKLVQVETMHQRKQQMYDNADLFLILPGGIGTIDELAEILTWKSLGDHNKPIVIYDFMNYWERLLKLITSMVRHGFARPSVNQLFDVITTEEDLFKKIKSSK